MTTFIKKPNGSILWQLLGHLQPYGWRSLLFCCLLFPPPQASHASEMSSFAFILTQQIPAHTLIKLWFLGWLDSLLENSLMVHWEFVVASFWAHLSSHHQTLSLCNTHFTDANTKVSTLRCSCGWARCLLAYPVVCGVGRLLICNYLIVCSPSFLWCTSSLFVAYWIISGSYGLKIPPSPPCHHHWTISNVYERNALCTYSGTHTSHTVQGCDLLWRHT